MSDQLFVEPAELRSAVREVASADAALERARGALAAADGLAARGLDGRAHDKVATFVRQWRSEHQLIGQMLRAYCSVVEEAAACYEELEAGIVGALCAEGS